MKRWTENIAFSLLIAAPSTVVCSILALLVSPIDILFRAQRLKRGQWSVLGTAIKVGWARWILWCYGIRVELEGPGVSALSTMRGSVFVSNHQSALDIPLMVKIITGDSSFIAKRELLWIPFFGWAAWVLGVLFIDRSKGTKNESLKNVTKHLKNGLSIIVFPEGTRSFDGHLLPLKRGAFVMAIEAKAPVVPIVILDSRLRMPKHKLTVSNGTIHIWVGEPVSTAQLKPEDRFELTEKISTIMAKQLENFVENRKNA